MRIKINDTEVVFPSSLSEITLKQRIDFHNAHGKLLDQMLQSIMQMPDDYIRELELIQFQMEKMYRTFAFFAGTTVESVKETELLGQVATIYNACLAVLFDDEAKLEAKNNFIWRGQEWEISPPTLSQGSKMKFGEIIDSKQMIKDMIDLGYSNWESLQKLAAIFFRKKGEEYNKEFLFEDSERLKLMAELPMDIALHVGFFLSLLTNSLVNTSLSFKNHGRKAVVDLQSNISKRMAG